MSERMQREISKDEITLMDFLRILKQYKWLVLASPLVMAVIALAIVTQMRPVWEASALIQVGKTGQTKQSEEFGKTRPTGEVGQMIEPPSSTVGRLMNPAFSYSVFRQIGISPDTASPELTLYRKSFKAKALPNTDLIEIKLMAYSVEEAKSQILVTLNQILTTHNEILNSRISYMKTLIQSIENNLDTSRNALEGLKQEITASKHGASERILYAMLYEETSKEIHDLEREKIQLEEALSPAWTFPTRLAEEVYVADEPASPKKGLIISLAALLGLLGAIFAAIVHHSHHNA